MANRFAPLRSARGSEARSGQRHGTPGTDARHCAIANDAIPHRHGRRHESHHSQSTFQEFWKGLGSGPVVGDQVQVSEHASVPPSCQRVMDGPCSTRGRSIGTDALIEHAKSARVELHAMIRMKFATPRHRLRSAHS